MVTHGLIMKKKPCMFKMDDMEHCFLEIMSEWVRTRKGEKSLWWTCLSWTGNCGFRKIFSHQDFQTSHLPLSFRKMGVDSSNLSAAINKYTSMSIVDLDLMLNDELKKRVASLVSLEDWADKCNKCGRPALLHRDRECTTQEQEPPDIVNKIWSDYRMRVKPILKTLKDVFKK